MRRNPELMQLEIGMSTNRYFPASGTAGLARSFVSGKRRVPWPPPMMTHNTLLVFKLWRPVFDIAFGVNKILPTISLPASQTRQFGKLLNHNKRRKLLAMMWRDTRLEFRRFSIVTPLNNLAYLVQPRDN